MKYFISHSKNEKDVQLSLWVASVLREENSCEVKMLESGIQPGSNVNDFISDAISWADVVVVIMTKAFMKSNHFQEELVTAKKLLPIKFEDINFKIGLLGSLLYLDLSGLNKIAAKEALVKALKGVERTSEQPQLPLTSNNIRMRKKEANLPERNPFFTGRDDIFEQINTAFKNAKMVVVTGIGGIGKTQLVCEFAYRSIDKYQFIWILNAACEMSLEASYREFAFSLGIPNISSMNLGELTNRIKLWSEINTSWLLIYDNAEGIGKQKLNIYLPQAFSNGHILICSRENEYDLGTIQITLGTFTNSESLAFFKSMIEGVSDSDANNLAEKLGYLPLAMNIAATYINQSQIQCSHYISMLENLYDSNANHDFRKSISTYFQTSMEQIKDEAAMQLLNLCAYCASNNIPMTMFIDGRDELPTPIKDALAPENALEHTRLINELTKHSLLSLNRNDNGDVLLSMHRLIQEVVIEKHLDNTWFKYCLNMAYNIFRYDYGNLLSMNKFILYLPHVMQIANHGNGKLCEGTEALEKIARLFFEAGFGSYCEGNYTQALEWYGEALSIREKSLGYEHPDTATTYNNIALVYNNQGDYTRALEWYSKALIIFENTLGTEHPDSAATYNNIAGIYQNQGDYLKALEWYHKALAIRERILGQEHPYTATTYNNIAFVYYNQGEYNQALEWYEKALLISEKVLGKAHPDTATTYNNIAGVYNSQGEYAKALEWYENALLIYEKVLGLEHPDTATTYNNIAGIYSRQGEYSRALEWYEKALLIREKVLGKEHPDTATTYNNIAGIYSRHGEFPRALEWYYKALLVREKVLGKEHPAIATTYNNIAGVYSSQSDYFKALEWYQKALSICEKVLGDYHPDTAKIYNNIAEVYSRQGDYSKALEWYNKDLYISEKILGKEHPNTAITYNNIAEVYDSQGDYLKALEWYLKAFSIYVRVYGIYHQFTVSIKKNIEDIYKNTTLPQSFEKELLQTLRGGSDI